MNGITSHWKDFPELLEVVGNYERHIEIERWRRQSESVSGRWIALDDRAYWYQPNLSNLVCCDAWTGMTDASEG